jgi:hypothetical protein
VSPSPSKGPPRQPNGGEETVKVHRAGLKCST